MTLFDDKCGRCGKPAQIVGGANPRCWACARLDSQERRADVLAGKVKWGPWHYRPDNLTLVHDDGYDVDLERCRTSAEVLDWIAQVSGKDVVYDEKDVGHLVRALDEMLGLQARLCGGGQDHTIDIPALLRPSKQAPAED